MAAGPVVSHLGFLWRPFSAWSRVASRRVGCPQPGSLVGLCCSAEYADASDDDSSWSQPPGASAVHDRGVMSSVATRFPRPPGHGARLGADVAVRRVVVGYRLVGAIWATLLGVLALLGQTPGQVDRGVVAGTLALVWGWTLLTVLLAERREAILTGWPWVATAEAVGAWAITASAVAGSRGISIAGGWPFAVVLLAVWARGFAGGLVTALVLSAVAVFRLASVGLPPATLPAASEAVGSALVYLAGAAVGSWGIGVLRRAEADRLAVEQALSSERAESPAHLHDSVLQTLALIQRRSDDPVEVVGLAPRQPHHLHGVVTAALDERQRLQHRIVQVGGALGALGGQRLLDRQPVRLGTAQHADAPRPHRRSRQVHQRRADRLAGRRQGRRR